MIDAETGRERGKESGVGDLVAFLSAQWNEIEAAARAAVSGRYGWAEAMTFIVDDYTDRDLDACYAHALAHDPAAVLADVESKRRIIARCADVIKKDPNPSPALLTLAEDTLTDLALPFADRPGYRDEWRLT